MKRREALLLLDKLLTIDRPDARRPLRTTTRKSAAEYEVAIRAAPRIIWPAAAARRFRWRLRWPMAGSPICNPEFNAVILNLGKSQGVKEGMPFAFTRTTTRSAR